MKKKEEMLMFNKTFVIAVLVLFAVAFVGGHLLFSDLGSPKADRPAHTTPAK